MYLVYLTDDAEYKNMIFIYKKKRENGILEAFKSHLVFIFQHKKSAYFILKDYCDMYQTLKINMFTIKIN